MRLGDGGPAALEAALTVQRPAGDRARVTLLSDRAELVYRPFAVAEPFGRNCPYRGAVPQNPPAICPLTGFAARDPHRAGCETAPEP